MNLPCPLISADCRHAVSSQTLLMFAAIFAVIAVGCVTLGGPAEIWRTADEGGRIEFFK